MNDIDRNNINVHNNITNKIIAKIRNRFLIGNTMKKHINGYGLTNYWFNVETRFYRAPKLCSLTDHIKSAMQTGEADKIVIHLGSNNFTFDKSSLKICYDIIILAIIGAIISTLLFHLHSRKNEAFH